MHKKFVFSLVIVCKETLKKIKQKPEFKILPEAAPPPSSLLKVPYHENCKIQFQNNIMRLDSVNELLQK